MLPFIWANIFSSCNLKDRPGFFSNSQIRMHGECTDTYPIEGTSEVDREILNGSRQKSACGNMTSGTEALHLNMTERLEKVEKDLRLMERKCTAWCDDFESRLRLLENCNRAFPGRVTQKEPEDKEENRKMKEKIKQLKARNHELLSKLMSMHKQSENMNDPSRLSAVLHLYEMVRLHDWEKCRKSSTNMTYTNGRSIIKKLFDACEEYIEKRKNDIFNVLDISSLNYAYESQEFANCKQELMPIVTELLRNAYCQRYSDFNKIITEQASVTLENDDQKQFALRCCRVYCLMLLQESPVKAVWHPQEILPQHVEHVDKKAFEHWKKTGLLWPVLKSGEEVIVKGVVWDLK